MTFLIYLIIQAIRSLPERIASDDAPQADGDPQEEPCRKPAGVQDRTRKAGCRQSPAC